MVSFIGNNIRPNGRGLIPPKKTINGGHRSIIGNGSGLFSSYLPINLLTHSCNVERYILYDGVFAGPYAADIPAFRTIDGVPHLQVERTFENLTDYSVDFSGKTFGRTARIPNATASPIGTSDATKVREDSTASNTHYWLPMSFTPDGSSPYIYSIYVKQGERHKTNHRFVGGGFAGTPNLLYDSLLGTRTGGYAGEMIDAGNGWYLSSISATSNAAAADAAYIHLLDNSGNISYNGDGTSGLYFWGSSLGIGSWVGSYVPTNGSAEIRPPVTVQVASVSVPSWMRDKFTITFIPYYSSSQIGEDHILCEMRDATEDYVLALTSAGTVTLTGSVTGLIFTKSALTWAARGTPIKFDFYTNYLETDVCRLNVRGADTGDGEVSGAASSNISYDSDFHIGTSNIAGDEADGLIWVETL